MSTPISTLRTPWVPDEPTPLPEYPRPQMVRSDWENLNGWWQYAILPKDSGFPVDYDGQILVPYAVESLLSGVQKPLLPDQTLWYRRTFQDPRPRFFHKIQRDGNVLLHFGAVDYECSVWVNGTRAGGHRGGYLPFSLDITHALREGGNEILVSVWDPTDTGLQQRGKQVLKPNSIWYTPVSGIWQTVWLEGVPNIYIESLWITPDLDEQSVSIAVTVKGFQKEGFRLAVDSYNGKDIVSKEEGNANETIHLPVPDPRLWSPADPCLYDLRVRLLAGDRIVDEVTSYFAMRKFGRSRDADGFVRFTLNDQPLFLYGPLDQGYFPDGLYTPPSEQAMVFDIDYAKSIGCNMIRKHVKVEPLRWYYHCDRLGMIVWQDMPNGGRIDGALVATLSLLFGFHRKDTRRLQRFGRADEANRREFQEELKGMVDVLYNAACIAVWVPYNESWGQFNANETAAWVKQYDPTRLVDHASGWFDQGGGDFHSKHIYVKRLKSPELDERIFVLSEFGGYSLKIPGHIWDESKKFGYRFLNSSRDLMDAYLDLLENQLKPLISQGLAAAIYTQTTDVEIEVNGYLTYDRKVEKMDNEQITRAHVDLISALTNV
jgi:beta-galactosidase/beta-glucuronidase